MAAMNKETIKAALRAHEPELKAAGVLHLHLFGSHIHGEARGDSDVDLAAEFDRSRRLSLFDLAAIANRLSDIIGAEADLSDADRLKDYVRKNFEREAELVF